MADNRKNYRNFWEMLDLLQKLRTSGMSKSDIMANVRPSMNKPFGVSAKTAGRLIESIAERYDDDFYFDAETQKYYLDADDIPANLEIEELSALDTVIKKSVKNETLKAPLTSLYKKLTRRYEQHIAKRDPTHKYKLLADAEAQRTANTVFVGPHAIINVDLRTKKLLEDAIFHQESLSIVYTSGADNIERTHIIDPLGLMYGPNNLYLVAKNEKGIRYYVLESMKNIKKTGKKFIKDNDFSLEKYAEKYFSIFKKGDVYDVEWLVKKEVVPAAKRFMFHPTQEFIDNPDGSMTVKLRAGGLDAMATHIFSWNGGIIPIKPQELVARYRERLTQCLAQVE